MPDKMLQGRLFSYPDTHRHRIGVNYAQLPINRPISPVNTYNKDGAMRYHSGDQPVYAPNSAGGPKARSQRHGEQQFEVSGMVQRSPYAKHAQDSDFIQPGNLWRNVLSDADRNNLVSNIVGHMTDGVAWEIQSRQLELWRQVDIEFGARIAKGLGNGHA